MREQKGKGKKKSIYKVQRVRGVQQGEKNHRTALRKLGSNREQPVLSILYREGDIRTKFGPLL